MKELGVLRASSWQLQDKGLTAELNTLLWTPLVTKGPIVDYQEQGWGGSLSALVLRDLTVLPSTTWSSWGQGYAKIPFINLAWDSSVQGEVEEAMSKHIKPIG